MQLLTSKAGLAAMSELGTFRTSSDVRSLVAIGGKADTREKSILVANDPKRTWWLNNGAPRGDPAVVVCSIL